MLQVERCSRGGKNFFHGGGALTILTTNFYYCRFGFEGAPPPFPVCAVVATNKVGNLNVLRVMLRLTNIGSLSSKFEILYTLSSQRHFKLTELNRMLQANQMHSTSLFIYFTLFRNHLTHAICCKLVTILP